MAKWQKKNLILDHKIKLKDIARNILNHFHNFCTAVSVFTEKCK